MAHAFNPSTQQAEAGGSEFKAYRMSSRTATTSQRNLSQNSSNSNKTAVVMCECFSCICICQPRTCPVPVDSRNGVGLARIGVTEGGELACGYWELSLGLLGEQLVHLTAALS